MIGNNVGQLRCSGGNLCLGDENLDLLLAGQNGHVLLFCMAMAAV
jgi:hypothetical protein